MSAHPSSHEVHQEHAYERVWQHKLGVVQGELDRYKHALLEIADVYHDSVLNDTQAQNATYRIVVVALAEKSPHSPGSLL